MVTKLNLSIDSWKQPFSLIFHISFSISHLSLPELKARRSEFKLYLLAFVVTEMPLG